MPAVSRELFHAALWTLEPEEFVAFVAALYSRRGREVGIVDERRLRIDDRCVYVHAPGRRGGPSVPDDADAVVAVETGRPRGVSGDVEVIDGDALYELAVYGVGAADRGRLLEHLLGAADWPPAAGERVHRPDLCWRPVVAGVLAIALVVAGVVGATGLPWGTGVGGDPGAGAGDRPGADAPEVTATGRLGGVRTPFLPRATATQTTRATTSASAPLAPADYPAWLAGDGSVDAAALAEAHARAVSGRAYTLVLVASIDHRRQTAGGVRQRLSVASPSVYRSTATVRGDSAVPWLDVVYADGTRAYVLVNRSNRTYRVRPPETAIGERAGPPGSPRIGASPREGIGPVAAFAGAYLERALSIGEPTLVATSVSDGTRLFYLRARNAAEPATDVATLAVVEADGFVRRLYHQYDARGAGVTVSVTMRYDLGATAITPPAWYRNGTRLGDDPDAEGVAGTSTDPARRPLARCSGPGLPPMRSSIRTVGISDRRFPRPAETSDLRAAPDGTGTVRQAGGTCDIRRSRRNSYDRSL